MFKWRLIGEWRSFVRDDETMFLGAANPWRCHWVDSGEILIIVRDPKSRLQGHWARIYNLADSEPPLRFAAYLSGETWSLYEPASPDDPKCFDAVTPRYEGHWRSSSNEVSTLPWPVSDGPWCARGAFIGRLAKVEAVAERILYRGKSL